MEHDSGVVTRGHRRLRSNEANPEAPAVKRARQAKGADEGGTMAMDLQNGHANGAPAPPSRLGSKQLIDRAEYVRLLEQALSDLGFHEAAAQLQRESGIALEPPTVERLRNAVKQGAFDKAVQLVGQLQLASTAQTQHAQFLLYEQKYLEALERQQTAAAVSCLRTELAALAPPCSPARLHRLAACLLAASPAELHALAGWPPGGSSPAARQSLLTALQDIVPPALMVPERRLEALVEQALTAQLSAAMFHNHAAAAVSLLTDYRAGTEHIPTRTVQVLQEHNDEVWHVAFSPDGTHLASSSKDGTACVWQVSPRGGQRLAHRHTLRGHSGPVVFVAWSPDSSKLATCGNDGSLRIWNVAKGSCMLVVKQHSAEVTSAVWLPDGERIITGSHDKNMHMHSVTGELLRTWRGHRINDLAMTADGRHLLATPSGEACVRVYQLEGERETALLSAQSIISICLAADSRDLLVHLANGRINLVELPEEMSGSINEEPIRTYDGPHPSQRTGHWVIRSCFGGCNQSFVLSGSEECKVYVWHRGSGELLAQLEGHTGTVNAVAWNPVNHRMFVSASDDRSIHVWGPK